MANSLEDIFKTYEAKKEIERKKAEEKSAIEDARRGESRSVLNSVIYPELILITEKIRASKYNSRIDEKTDIRFLNPHIEFLFYPPQVNGSSHSKESKLSFTHIQGGGIRTTVEIHSNSFSDTLRNKLANANTSVKVNQVTTEWVRDKAHSFVEMALEAN